MRRRIEKQIIDKEVVDELFSVFDQMEQKGFERREGQIDMSLDVAEAIRDDDNLIIEAGVGIGKSFAYLFPSILSLQSRRKPVVIASSTIHLTNQLEEDVRNSEKILNKGARSIVGKGQSHYFCEERANRQIKSNDVSQRLKNFIQNYPNSDVKLDNNEWGKVNVKRCKFNQCELRFGCEFYKMRQGLLGHGEKAGDIIIINQDLLIANYLKEDRTGRPLLNDNHETVIIDEAHNLEEKARNALTKTFSKKDILEQLSNAERSNGKIYTKLKKDISDFFNQIDSHLSKELATDRTKSGQVRMFLEDSHVLGFDNLSTDVGEVYSLIQIQTKNVTDDQIEKFDDLVTLFEIIFSKEESDYIYWLELKSGKVSISFAPNNISQKLRQLVFDRDKHFILTSATLASGLEDKDYEFVKKSIGFEGLSIPSKLSPFPFEKNARLYLPETMTKYDNPYHIDTLVEKIISLSKASKGHTMVLFTSKEEMEKVYQMLKKNRENKYHVIIQSNKNEKDTIDEFRESKGILLATGTYWEGLNIQGSDLSQLIIARLPFPVPDPVIEHKTNSSDNPHEEVIFPEMILKLRQGVGRLIRSSDDIGVLSILDYRLAKSNKYKSKETILNSIPINNQIHELNDIEIFLNN